MSAKTVDDMIAEFYVAGERALSKRLGPTPGKAELVLQWERRGTENVFIGAEVVITPDAPHNAETCRDPACECWPF
jgi:hypothetical protein